MAKKTRKNGSKKNSLRARAAARGHKSKAAKSAMARRVTRKKERTSTQQKSVAHLILRLRATKAELKERGVNPLKVKGGKPSTQEWNNVRKGTEVERTQKSRRMHLVGEPVEV